MDDALGMSCVKGVGDFNGEIENVLGRERTSRDGILQGAALEEFHGNEGPSVVFSDFIDRADVGMVESGSSTRLAAKSFERLWVMSNFVRQEFQRNETPKLGVLGFVDDTHSTTAKLFDDAVVRDSLANHWAEVLGPVIGQVTEGKQVAWDMGCQLA
jgi:hypothetical protein